MMITFSSVPVHLSSCVLAILFVELSLCNQHDWSHTQRAVKDTHTDVAQCNNGQLTQCYSCLGTLLGNLDTHQSAYSPQHTYLRSHSRDTCAYDCSRILRGGWLAFDAEHVHHIYWCTQFLHWGILCLNGLGSWIWGQTIYIPFSCANIESPFHLFYVGNVYWASHRTLHSYTWDRECHSQEWVGCNSGKSDSHSNW